MAVYARLSIQLMLVFFISCDSTKKTVDVKDSSNGIDETYVSKGYSIGVIKYFAGSKCNWIIIDEIANTKFDPINIGEDNFKRFMIDDNGVYFKYRPLRRKNRCNDVQPIELVDIQNR